MGFQIGGAILDFVVLSILNHQDEYGYLLTQQVQQILDISETAMYPALKRLQKANYLSTYDSPFQGRNRRYYSISPDGKSALARYEQDWKIFQHNMDLLLEGGHPLDD